MRWNSLALTDVQAALLARVRTEGGFSQQRGEPYRTDATAWAIITLSSIDADMTCIQPAMTRLTADQHEDGSISIAPDHPEAFWPTPLAVLAWSCSPVDSEPRRGAIGFLLRTTGKHWEKRLDEIGRNLPKAG